MSGGHLIDRPGHLVACHGCHHHVLAAVTAGRTVAADPQSITPVAELAARIKGHSAYDVITSGTKIYLAYRDIFRTRATRVYPVVADHQCPAGALPRYQLIPPKKPARKKTIKSAPAVLEEIPF